MQVSLDSHSGLSKHLRAVMYCSKTSGLNCKLTTLCRNIKHPNILNAGICPKLALTSSVKKIYKYFSCVFLHWVHLYCFIFSTKTGHNSNKPTAKWNPVTAKGLDERGYLWWYYLVSDTQFLLSAHFWWLHYQILLRIQMQFILYKHMLHGMLHSPESKSVREGQTQNHFISLEMMIMHDISYSNLMQ